MKSPSSRSECRFSSSLSEGSEETGGAGRLKSSAELSLGASAAAVGADSGASAAVGAGSVGRASAAGGAGSVAGCSGRSSLRS